MAKIKKYMGVYKIYCKNDVTGKCYIGSSNDIKKRWSVHKALLRSNKHYNVDLQKIFNKYGEESFEFEILEECLNKDLYLSENKWMSFLGEDNLYNHGSITNFKKQIRRGKASKLHKDKFSILNSGENNPNARIKVEDVIEIKRMLSENFNAKEIAIKFKLSFNHIINIKNGHRWASVAI